MSDNLSKYYAYYTGAPALRVVLKARIKKELAKMPPKPKGRKKPKSISFPIFGGSMVLQEGAGVEDVINKLSRAQVKRAIQGLPLATPSGCSWDELWEAYKEKYL